MNRQDNSTGDDTGGDGDIFAPNQSIHAPTTPVQSDGARIAEAIADRVAMEKRRKFSFRLLFVCLLSLGMGHSIMFAVLPALSRDLGMAEYQVQAVFASSALIWVFMAPFWGARSDIWGRRPVILIGLGGYAVSTILFATVVWAGLAGILAFGVLYPLMIITRTIYGTLGPGAMAASQAYVADRTSRKDRTRSLANIGAAFGLGIILGSGIGGPIANAFGLISPLFFVSFLAAISAGVVWFFLPEKTRPKEREDKPKLKFTDKRIRSFQIVSRLMGIAHAIPIQTMGFFLMDTLVLDPHEGIQYTSIALMGLSMASLFSQLVIVQRFPMPAQKLIQVGTIMPLLGALCFIWSDQFATMFFGAMLMGLGFGLARPGLSGAASLAVRRDEQGSISGLVGGLGAAGHVVVPVFMFFLYRIAPQAMYVMLASLSVIILIFATLDPQIIKAQVEVDEDEGTIDL